MTSKDVAFLLADLGVANTHSRPHVSNDNPHSEAHFKTLKYCPEFPQRFGAIEDARAFCRRFFDRYTIVHRHSGIAMMTPSDVHCGRVDDVVAQRARVLDTARREHPERFVQRTPPEPRRPPIGLDQPANAACPRSGCSVNSQTRCLRTVDKDRGAAESPYVQQGSISAEWEG